MVVSVWVCCRLVQHSGKGDWVRGTQKTNGLTFIKIEIREGKDELGQIESANGVKFSFSFFFSWREEDTQPLNKPYYFCVSYSSASLSSGLVNLQGNSLSRQPFENHWPKEMPVLEIIGCHVPWLHGPPPRRVLSMLSAWPLLLRVHFSVFPVRLPDMLPGPLKPYPSCNPELDQTLLER